MLSIIINSKPNKAVIKFYNKQLSSSKLLILTENVATLNIGKLLIVQWTNFRSRLARNKVISQAGVLQVSKANACLLDVIDIHQTEYFTNFPEQFKSQIVPDSETYDMPFYIDNANSQYTIHKPKEENLC